MSNMRLSIISVKTSFETDHQTLTILLLHCKKQLKKWGPGSPMSCSGRQKTMHDAQPNGNKHQIPLEQEDGAPLFCTARMEAETSLQITDN